jgi:predicted RNA-binding protein with EMAP domain
VVDCGVSIECDIVNDATLEEIKSFFINNLIKLKHVELNNIGEVDSKLISDIGSRNNILSCLLLSDCSYSITGFNIESIRNLYMNQCKQLKRLLVHEGWEEIGDRIVPTKLPPEILYSVQSNGMLLRSTIDGGKEEGGREILVGLQDELLEICPVWKALI